MAKRKARPTRKASKKRQPARRTAKKARTTRSVKRPKTTTARKLGSAAKKSVKKSAGRPKPRPGMKTAKAAGAKVPRLERTRRTLEDIVPTPPSSLNMVRRGTAPRTGRAENAEHQRDDNRMNDVAPR